MRAVTVSGSGRLRCWPFPEGPALPSGGRQRWRCAVHDAGFTRGELDWPHTGVDRSGHDQAPRVRGHELSGCG